MDASSTPFVSMDDKSKSKSKIVAATKSVKEYGKKEKEDLLSEIKAIHWRPEKRKSLTNISTDRKEKETFKNTVELTPNPLTALFLAQVTDLWKFFPKRMQQIWILCVVGVSSIQWFSCLFLQRYFISYYRKEKHSKHGYRLQFFYNYLCSTLLFIYLLGEMRRTWRTYQTALKYLNRDNMGYFIAFFFFIRFFITIWCEYYIGIGNVYGENN